MKKIPVQSDNQHIGTWYRSGSEDGVVLWTSNKEGGKKEVIHDLDFKGYIGICQKGKCGRVF